MSFGIMRVVFFLGVLNILQINGQPKPKPIIPKAIVTKAEVYQKSQPDCGPFIESLPKRKGDRLKSILERGDLTKKEIDQKVEEWISSQDSETQENYASFKRALKVRLLRLKLRHELKIKEMSDDAKKLDENIQEIIEDKELTWPETIKEKNKLIRKSSPKILKELGIKPEVVEKEESEENGEDPDYENQHEKYDYTNGGPTQSSGPPHEGYDYNNEHYGDNGDNEMRRPGNRPSRVKSRPIGERNRPGSDYQQNGDADYDN